MADLKSLNTRLDPELKGMLNRLLTGLTEYESSVKPIVSEYKKLKGQIKRSQKGLPTQQVKAALMELLNQKGFDTSLDYHPGNFSNLERAISSLIATDPGLWPDLVEKALSEGPEKGAKTIAGAQNKLLKELYSVGHHEQGLKSLRPILEALQGMGNSLRERTLHVLENKYGFDFGELGLRYIIPFAHTEGSLGPGRGPTGIRKDLQPLLDAAFPELGGVKSIDQINKNLRGLIKPLLAHSTAQHGTGGIIPPIDAVKGLTDPNKIAEALRPYLDAQKAGAENAMALSDTIFKHGFKKVNGELVLNKEAWLPDGVLEKNIKEIPIIGLSPEATWTKPIKQVVKPSIEEVGKYTGDAPWAQTMLNVTKKVVKHPVTRRVALGVGTALPLVSIPFSAQAAEDRELEAEQNPDDELLQHLAKLDRATYELDKQAVSAWMSGELVTAGVAEASSMATGLFTGILDLGRWSQKVSPIPKGHKYYPGGKGIPRKIKQ